MTKHKVQMAEELLETTTDPVSGLVELLDNALDADACTIAVTIEVDAMGKPEAVVVADDGIGMNQQKVLDTFLLFGRSDKATHPIGKGGRAVRGRHGRGRFAATAIGATVRWKTIAHTADETNAEVFVTLEGTGRDELEVSDQPTPSDERSTGTTVTVSDLTDRAVRKLQSQATRTKIGLIYAPYLQRQPSLAIALDGLPLKASKYWAQQPVELPLNVPGADSAVPLTVRVVEWDPKVTLTRPVLVLGAGDGEPLLDLPGLPDAPYKYSAYLSWNEFAKNQQVLALGENAPGDVGAAIDGAFTAIAGWVARRTQHGRAALIARWKTERTYPYPDSPPADVVEEAERALFDVVATTAGPALDSGDAPSRRLSLALIREALRHDPEDVTRVIGHVLKLPAADMRTLSSLLERTTLSAIIATAQLVAERQRILDELELLTSETRTRKGLLEKSVHALAAAHPWLFGDTWTLARSEAGLTQVLKAHRGLLGDPVLADSPDEVITLDGHVARVDVLLARTLENAANSRERLIVELKRPGLALGSNEATQIEQYAERISGDGRFTAQDIRWEFLLIGSGVERFVRNRADTRGYLSNNFGTATSTVAVRVTSWDTLIKENRHRLAFVAHELNVVAREPLSQEAVRAAKRLTVDPKLGVSGAEDNLTDDT